MLINNFSNNNSGFSIQFSGHIFVTNPYDALDCSIINNLLGPPISACDGDSITLDATTATAINYDWLEDQGSGFMPISGEHNPTLQVTSSGVYRVNVIMPSNNNIISDVQVVFSTMPIANAINDDFSCSGSAMYDLAQKDAEALGGQSPSEFIVSYHTSLSDATDGINSLPKQYLMGSGSETIYVRVTSISNPICFDASQYFQLINLETPIMDFETEVQICADNSSVAIGEISPPNPNYTYLWDSGETTSSIVVSAAGSYTVTATNNQAGTSCSDSRIINVTTSTTPMITDVLIEDLQNNNTVTIITNVTDNIEFQLDNGVFQDSNVFTDVLPGMHTVTVNDINGCGMVTEQLVVVGFPKFFTPNGDGNNDLWHIAGVSSLEEPVIFIHDRFGKLLKQLNGNDAGWDGTFNGNPLPSSDYWFKLTYLDSNGLRSTTKYVNSHFSLRR